MTIPPPSDPVQAIRRTRVKRDEFDMWVLQFKIRNVLLAAIHAEGTRGRMLRDALKEIHERTDD